MTIDLMDMFQRHGYEDAFLFGHALEGNLHLVFSQASATPCRPLARACHQPGSGAAIAVLKIGVS